MHTPPLFLFFIGSASINLSLAIYGWQHRSLPGARAFSLAILMFACLPLSQAVSLTSSALMFKVVALKSRVEISGIGAIAWLVMVMQFSGQSHWMNRRLLAGLSIPLLGMMILNWSENPLFRSGYYLDWAGNSPILHWTNGPVFWLGWLYLNTLLLTPLYLLWRSFGRISPLSFQQTLMLSISTVLPLLVNALSQFGFVLVQGINFPFAAGPVMGLIVAWAILRAHIFDLAPVARGLLIESMSDGVLVLDTRNRIVDINPAMKGLIGAVTIGQGVEAAFAAWPELAARFRDVVEVQTEIILEDEKPEYFDLRISSLLDRRGRLTGRLIVVRDITRHKQTENALRVSEERYRKLINSARDLIVTLSSDGRITSLNSWFETFIGWSRDDWLGRSFEELIAEDDRPRLREQFQRVLRSDTLRAIRLRVLTRSGGILVVELSVSPQFKEGRVVGFAGIARDVTAEQRAEEALKASEKLYRALIEQGTDQISLVGVDGTLIYENPTIARPLGYPLGTFVGLSLFELIHPDDTDRARQTWEDVLNQSGRSLQAIFRLKHANGSWRWMEGTATNLLNEPGVQAIVMNYRDVTERRQMEEALRESEERYRLFIQHASEAIYVCDADTRQVLDANPAFLNLLGYTEQEARRLTQYDFIAHPHESIDAYFEQMLNEGSVDIGERKWRRKDGTLLDLDVTVSRVVQQGHAHIFVLARDISARKQAEAVLRESEQKYHQLVELTPNGILIHVDGKIVYTNSASTTILGAAAPAELLGKRLLDFVHSDYQNIVRGRVKQMTVDKSSVPLIEEKLVRLDGAVIDAEVAAIPFDYQHRNAVQVVFNDITKRKRTEEALRASEEQFRTLFQNAPVGISVTDLQGDLLAFNDAILSPGNYTRADMEKIRNVAALYYDPQERKEVLTLFQQQGRLSGYDVQFRRKDGTSYHALLSLTHTIFNGQPAVQAIVEDITERKRSEEKLRVQNNYLAALHEITVGLVNHHDPNSVLQAILTHVTQLMKTHHAFVDIVDPAENMLINKVATGNFVDQLGFRTKRDEGLTGSVWNSGEVIIIPDYSVWTGSLPEFQWLKTIAGFPMKVEGKVMGVIGIALDEPVRSFTSEEIDLLQRFTNLAAVVLDNAQLFTGMRRQSQELSLLHKVRSAISREIDLTHIVKRTVEAIAETFGYTLVSLYLLEGDILILQHQVGYAHVIAEVPTSQGILGRVAHTGKPVFLEDVNMDTSFLEAIEGIVSEVAVPIFDEGRTVGVLNIESRQGVKLTEQDLRLMTALSDQIGVAIERARLHETLRQESIRDRLTGLYNRRFMEEALLKELKRAERNARSLVVVMLDLDHFKNINDTFGHDGGDKALQRLSLLLKTSFRGSDIACRYGGEEFTLILPDASLSDAMQRIEQLRKGIKQLKIQHQGKSIPPLTSSFGIAIFPEHGTTGETLLKAADKALYRAKQSGRDRVITA